MACLKKLKKKKVFLNILNNSLVVITKQTINNTGE